MRAWWCDGICHRHCQLLGRRSTIRLLEDFRILMWIPSRHSPALLAENNWGWKTWPASSTVPRQTCVSPIQRNIRLALLHPICQHCMQLFSIKLRLSLSHSMISHQHWDSMHVIILMSERGMTYGMIPAATGVTCPNVLSHHVSFFLVFCNGNLFWCDVLAQRKSVHGGRWRYGSGVLG